MHGHLTLARPCVIVRLQTMHRTDYHDILRLGSLIIIFPPVTFTTDFKGVPNDVISEKTVIIE
jgi:hypothetical protein